MPSEPLWAAVAQRTEVDLVDHRLLGGSRGRAFVGNLQATGDIIADCFQGHASARNQWKTCRSHSDRHASVPRHLNVSLHGKQSLDFANAHRATSVLLELSSRQARIRRCFPRFEPHFARGAGRDLMDRPAALTEDSLFGLVIRTPRCAESYSALPIGSDVVSVK